MRLTEKITINGVPNTYLRADVDEWLREHGREPLRYFADTIEAWSKLAIGEAECWLVTAVEVGDAEDDVSHLGWFYPMEADEA